MTREKLLLETNQTGVPTDKQIQDLDPTADMKMKTDQMTVDTTLVTQV